MMMMMMMPMPTTVLSPPHFVSSHSLCHMTLSSGQHTAPLTVQGALAVQGLQGVLGVLVYNKIFLYFLVQLYVVSLYSVQCT